MRELNDFQNHAKGVHSEKQLKALIYVGHLAFPLQADYTCTDKFTFKSFRESEAFSKKRNSFVTLKR